MKNSVKKIIRILILFFSLSICSCLTFGLIATSFWYVVKDTNGMEIKIDCIEDSLIVNVGYVIQSYDLDGDNFKAFAIPDTILFDEISICFDSLILDTFNKRTNAKIFFEKNGWTTEQIFEESIDIKDTCLVFTKAFNKERYWNRPYNQLVFLHTDHGGSSKAILEGSFSINVNGKFRGKRYFKYELEKRSYKPFIYVGN